MKDNITFTGIKLGVRNEILTVENVDDLLHFCFSDGSREYCIGGGTFKTTMALIIDCITNSRFGGHFSSKAL